jgi:hypothetical protein
VGADGIYWTSRDARKGAALLALCILGELGNVYGQVRLAIANSHVFNAVNGQIAAMARKRDAF